MRKRWYVEPASDRAQKLSEKYGIGRIIVQVLINRNIPEIEFLSFLDPSRAQLHSPLLLPDIALAVRRIRKAVAEKEKIFLFGDYDVDGITSLAIFYDYIKHQGADVSFYIPHRSKEGYGLNAGAVGKIKKEKAQLLICFDCGTNASEEIELARSGGIDTIVVDHHQPKGNTHAALACINPKRKDSQYPFSDLSGAGVTFKLVEALCGKEYTQALDLVALATVCDVVPLLGENRILLKRGLEHLRCSQRASIAALCEASGIKQENIDTFHLGYILGPRINASGRVNTAQDALDLFLGDDIGVVRKHARKLEEYNQLRRSIEGTVLKEAEESLGAYDGTASAVVVHSAGWHHGVLGIVASRLVDKYYRPTFVIGFDQERGKGSARSIDNFDLMEALHQCQEYLTAYGGHRKAAGIEIRKKDVADFTRKFNEVAAKMLSPHDLLPLIKIDAEIGLDDLNIELADDVESLKPFGEGNSSPLFLTKGVYLKQEPKKISNGKYSLWLSDDRLTYEGVVFARSGLVDIFKNGEVFDIVYGIEKNCYHNSVRLTIKDVRLH